MMNLTQTADEIASMRGAIRRKADYEALREYCDMLTCGDLDCTQLDILTGMVERRIRKAIPTHILTLEGTPCAKQSHVS